MVEATSEPWEPVAELADAQLEWEVPTEKIKNMSREELVDEVVNLTEKTRRLHAVAMLAAQSIRSGQPIKPQDIEDILNPKAT